MYICCDIEYLYIYIFIYISIQCHNIYTTLAIFIYFCRLSAFSTSAFLNFAMCNRYVEIRNRLMTLITAKIELFGETKLDYIGKIDNLENGKIQFPILRRIFK